MKNYKEKLKSEKGSITLVVLVTLLFFITILSTAYVVIATQRKSQLKSEISIKETYEKDFNNIEGILSDIYKVAVNIKARENTTINGGEPSASNPIIPEGYIPIDTDTTSWGDGTTAPDRESVDKGLVITDSVDANGKSNGNEWVWIPVPDVNVMCNTMNQAEYTLCGTSGENAVKTKLYTKSEIISGQTRTTPGATSGYREPDLVVGNDGISYDALESYRKEAGFMKDESTTMSTEEIAKEMVNNYATMIESINKYKGFYIGRYELSDAGEKKKQPTLTKKNWYSLYKKCTELKASDKVKTEMIWGCQWDVACNFIANYGERKSITNSSGWGNYSDSTGDAAVKEADGTTNAYGKKQNTGYSEFWKANNIYDFAGNCFEWTQEADYLLGRVSGGGSCYRDGYNFSASVRSYGNPNYSNLISVGSRSTLIVK